MPRNRLWGGWGGSRNSSSPMRNRLMSPLEAKGWLLSSSSMVETCTPLLLQVRDQAAKLLRIELLSKGFSLPPSFGLVLRRAWPNYPPTADAIPPPSRCSRSELRLGVDWAWKNREQGLGIVDEPSFRGSVGKKIRGFRVNSRLNAKLLVFTVFGLRSRLISNRFWNIMIFR